MKAYEKYISKADIEKIHAHTLTILKKVGVKFEHEEALSVFKEHGARIEGDKVYIEEKMLKEALETVPKKFTIYSSKGDVHIGNHSYVKLPVSGSAYLQDGNRIRAFTNKDIIDWVKLSDTSPVLDCVMTNPCFTSKEFTQDETELGFLALLLKYANKPIPFANPNTATVAKGRLREAYRRGIRLVQDYEGIYDRVVGSHGFNPITPLCYDHDPLERMFAVCEEKQSVWFATCAMPVLTAPFSVISLLTVANAELLAGIVLSQLIQPGTPIIYANVSGSTDLRSVQLCMGNPEAALIFYATAGIADYYGIPFRTGGAFSDAKELDYQAGMEAMLSIRTTSEVKPDMIFHALGTMGTYNVTCFEKFILDEEIYNFTERLNTGIDASEEKFCMDIIEKTGPRGNFLTGRTPKMFREEFYITKYLNKLDPNEWQNHGSLSLKEKMQGEVKKRIDSFKPAPVTKEQEKLLNQYIPAEYRNGL